MPALGRLLNRTAIIAVLRQEVRVRLVNLSRSGCLLIAPRALRVGAVGRLCIALDGAEYVGEVRLVRCEALRGPSYRVGFELLWISMGRGRS